MKLLDLEQDSKSCEQAKEECNNSEETEEVQHSNGNQSDKN